jgi:hypothetical protein
MPCAAGVQAASHRRSAAVQVEAALAWWVAGCMPRDVSRETGASLRRCAHYLGVTAKLCLVVLSAAYLVYVFGINLFMSTGLFDMVVDADPKTLDIHFDRGWSVRPGRIHATNLSVRNRDGSYEWILHIREVQFDISFLALARQRFQVSNVHGAGGSFRMRSRLDPSEVTPDRLEGIPPIDGFPAVPIRPFQQCAVNEWDDARYHLWTIQLEGVRADAVREIWFDRYRLDGETSASGRFYLKPVRAVEVGPLHTEIRDTGLSVDGSWWVERLDSSGDFALPRFDPRTGGGSDLLQRMSLAVESHGTLPEVDRLPFPMPPETQLHGALDVRRLAMRLEGGRPLPGSIVDTAGPKVVLENGDHRVSSAIAATATVEERDQIAFHAIAGSAHLERTGETVLRAPRVELTGNARRPLTGYSVEGLHLAVDSPDIEVPDVRVLEEYIPRSARVTLASGRAHAAVSGEAWADEGRAKGRASMQATDLDVSVGDVHMTGVMAAEARVASLDWRTGALEHPEGAVTVDSRVVVAPQSSAGSKELAADVHAVAGTRGYDARDRTIDVSGSGVRLRNMVVAGEPAPSSEGAAWLHDATLRLDRPLLQGFASLDVTDATPLLAGVRDRVPGPFRGLLDLPRLLASARLSVDARRVELSDMEAQGGRLNVHGIFAAGRGDRLGAFVVQGGPVSIGLGVDPAGAHVHFFGLSGWLQQEEETVSDRFGSPY